MSDFLNGLVEVKNKSNRVSDSASLIRRKRILDAKRRMNEKRDGNASSINRVSDSARPATRGMVKRNSIQGLTRKQDSASKSYMRTRQRVKDELSETETTEEAVNAVIAVLNENVEENPAEVLNAAEDIVTAVIETVGDLLPEGGEGDEAEAEPEGEPEYEEEVTDSARRAVVRRRGVADARKLAMIRRRVKDGSEKRLAAVRDNVARPSARPTVRRSVVKDSEARKRALAAARRVRDARARREVVRASVKRTADSRMRRTISRKD